MDQTIYYKNVGRTTAIYDDDYFIQLTKRKAVRSITMGRNKLIVEEAIENDVPCTEFEFQEMFDESQKEIESYIYIIKQLQNKADGA